MRHIYGAADGTIQCINLEIYITNNKNLHQNFKQSIQTLHFSVEKLERSKIVFCYILKHFNNFKVKTSDTFVILQYPLTEKVTTSPRVLFHIFSRYNLTQW